MDKGEEGCPGLTRGSYMAIHTCNNWHHEVATAFITERRRRVFRSFVRWALYVTVSTYFACCDIFLFRGEISTIFGTNVHHVSGHCSKGSRRSAVKGQGHNRCNQAKCYG